MERPRKYCNLVKLAEVLTVGLDKAQFFVIKLLVDGGGIVLNCNFPKNFLVATVIPILRRNFELFLPSSAFFLLWQLRSLFKTSVPNS